MGLRRRRGAGARGGAAAYLSSYFLGGRSHKAKVTDAALNTELPRLPLYVSRRLTALTRTTMWNKRRQRQLHMCQRTSHAEPAWASDPEQRLDVICLMFDVDLRLRHGRELRALISANP